MILFLIQIIKAVNISQNLEIRPGQYSQIQLNVVRQFQTDFNYGILKMEFQLSSTRGQFDLFYFPSTDDSRYICYLASAPNQQRLSDCFSDKPQVFDCFSENCTLVLKEYIVNNMQGKAAKKEILCKGCQQLVLNDLGDIKVHQTHQQPISPMIIIDNSRIVNPNGGDPQPLNITLTYDFEFWPNQQYYAYTIISTICLSLLFCIISLILYIAKTRFQKLKNQIEYSNKLLIKKETIPEMLLQIIFYEQYNPIKYFYNINWVNLATKIYYQSDNQIELIYQNKQMDFSQKNKKNRKVDIGVRTRVLRLKV
ncbi:hypothetical protein pb186bvf_009829 [Paramecium bursaria]